MTKIHREAVEEELASRRQLLECELHAVQQRYDLSAHDLADPDQEADFSAALKMIDPATAERIDKMQICVVQLAYEGRLSS